MLVEYDVDFDAKRDNLAKQYMLELGLPEKMAQERARKKILLDMSDKAYSNAGMKRAYKV